jgi:hypothetical protein
VRLYPKICLRTNLVGHLTHCALLLPVKNLPPILWRKHYVIFAVPFCVG